MSDTDEKLEASTEDVKRVPVWIRVNEHARMRCEAWYDPTRDGLILDDHPFYCPTQSFRDS